LYIAKVKQKPGMTFMNIALLADHFFGRDCTAACTSFFLMDDES
jgi:hypothetical protein